MLRRVMGDDAAAEVIFTFDPDEAYQKAALRAFSDEKLFSAQTYVAVAPDGLDRRPAAASRRRGGARAVHEPRAPVRVRAAPGNFSVQSELGRGKGFGAPRFGADYCRAQGSCVAAWVHA